MLKVHQNIIHALFLICNSCLLEFIQLEQQSERLQMCGTFPIHKYSAQKGDEWVEGRTRGRVSSYSCPMDAVHTQNKSIACFWAHLSYEIGALVH